MQFSTLLRHTAISRQASCLTNIFVILAVVVTGCTAYEEATLTCMFGENIGEQRQNFKLFDDQEELALKCTWRKEKLWCHVGGGYSFDFQPSDTASVQRTQTPNPSKCSCFIEGNDNTEHERPCFVEVSSDKDFEEGNGIITDVSKDKPSPDPIVENHTEPLISQTKKDDGGSTLITVLSASCALISLVAVALAIAVWKLWSRERRLLYKMRGKDQHGGKFLRRYLCEENKSYARQERGFTHLLPLPPLPPIHINNHSF